MFLEIHEAESVRLVLHTGGGPAARPADQLLKSLSSLSKQSANRV